MYPNLATSYLPMVYTHLCDGCTIINSYDVLVEKVYSNLCEKTNLLTIYVRMYIASNIHIVMYMQVHGIKGLNIKPCSF